MAKNKQNTLDLKPEEENPGSSMTLRSRLRPRNKGSMQDHTYSFNRYGTIYTTPLALIAKPQQEENNEEKVEKRKRSPAREVPEPSTSTSTPKKSKRRNYFQGARKRKRRPSKSPATATVTISDLVSLQKAAVLNGTSLKDEAKGQVSGEFAKICDRMKEEYESTVNEGWALEMHKKTESAIMASIAQEYNSQYGELPEGQAPCLDQETFTELYQAKIREARRLLQDAIARGIDPGSDNFTPSLGTMKAETCVSSEHPSTSDAGTSSSCSCSCRKAWKRKGYEWKQEEPTRKSERLVVKNYKLPFSQLPHVVKVKIFSFLSVHERAKASEVCHDWHDLIRSPGLWANMNLMVFNPYPNSPRPWYLNMVSYRNYKERIQKFVQYVGHIQPKLNSLHFCFDIANYEDQWLVSLLGLLEKCKCQELLSIECNWQETPPRPPCADVTCCVFNKTRLAFRQHIQRLRAFHMMLYHLTTKAPNLRVFQCPFDWSPRSVLYLCRWKYLETLHLPLYFTMKPLDQSLLDLLLRKLPYLRELVLHICVFPQKKFTTMYTLTHKSLVSLEIQHCKGFCLKSVNLPALEQLKMCHHPKLSMFNTGNTEERAHHVQCLYSLFVKGARKLAYFNKHKLFNYWLEYEYEDLTKMLEKICPCLEHRHKLLGAPEVVAAQ